MGRIYTSRDVTMSLYEFSEARQKSPGIVYGIPWPWKRLNYLTGGMQKEELTILMARPSRGKTAFLCQVTYSVACWLKANRPGEVFRIVCVEQSPQALQMRMACGALGISQRLVKQGKLTPKQLSDFRTKLDEIGSLPIEYLDPMSLDHTIKFVSEGRENNATPKGLTTAVWAVDYLQIHPLLPGKNSNPFQTVTDLSEGFRNLARHVAPGIVLSQMSRDIEKSDRKDKTPKLSDLRGSGSIEQDASLVIAPVRDDDFLVIPEEFRGDPVLGHFILLKNRNDETGNVDFEWFPRTMSFEDRSNYGDEGAPE